MAYKYLKMNFNYYAGPQFDDFSISFSINNSINNNNNNNKMRHRNSTKFQIISRFVVLLSLLRVVVAAVIIIIVIIFVVVDRLIACKRERKKINSHRF